MEPDHPPSLFTIGTVFLGLGAVAFGGLGAALSLIQRQIVETRGWLTQADLTQAIAFTKPLPGSTVIQVVAFLGWRLHRWPGALIATLAFLAPSMGLMIAAAATVASLPDTPWVTGALAGVQVAVVGLLASAVMQLAQSTVKDRSLSVALALAFAWGFVIPAALVVVTVGVAGIVWSRRDRSHA